MQARHDQRHRRTSHLGPSIATSSGQFSIDAGVTLRLPCENCHGPSTIRHLRQFGRVLPTVNLQRTHESIGVTNERLHIDSSHTIFLGPAQDYCGMVIWKLIQADAFGVARTTLEERVALSVQRLRGELFDWYRLRRSEGVPDDWTELQDITPTMVGTKAKPVLKSKATCNEFVFPGRSIAIGSGHGAKFAKVFLCQFRRQRAIALASPRCLQ